MRRALRAAAVGLALVGLLAGCAGTTAPAPTRTLQAATSVATQQHLVYRTVAGQRLALDACLPRPARRAPVLVLVHGGGFSNGLRSDLAFVCQAAAKAGFATFTVDYRLLPATYPAQVQDVAAAITWLTAAKQAKRFSLDPSSIGIVGASAGATIAAELATGTPGSGFAPSRLRAAVLLSGFYDTNGTLGASAFIKPEYLGCTGAACTEAGKRASPIDHVAKGDPAMLLVGSTDELTPLSQLQTFASALQKAGVSHRTLVEDGDSHAEAVFVTHPASATTVLDFLREHLR